MIKPILERKNISPAILSKAEFIYTCLGKLDEIASQHLLTTISFPETILEANFDGDNSIIGMPTSGMEFYKISTAFLEQKVEKKEDITSSEVSPTYTNKIRRPFYDSSDRIQIFSIENEKP